VLDIWNELLYTLNVKFPLHKENDMKFEAQNQAKSELTKNLFAAGLTGASFGLLYASGFEMSLVLGVLIGALFGIAIGFRLTYRPPKMRYPMRLARRMAYAATFFLLVSMVYSYLIDLDLTRSQAVLVTLLPTLGWTALVVSIGMAIASLDELQRRIQTEAIAIGFAGTAIFVAGYALLQFAGFATINLGVVLLVMAAMWLVGKLWTLWRYR
jgi:hypothetical protein